MANRELTNKLSSGEILQIRIGGTGAGDLVPTMDDVNATNSRVTALENLHNSVLSTYSLVTQEPSGTGDANSIQLIYGTSAITTTEADYATSGAITFKVAGTYMIHFSAHFGRTGSASASHLVFRLMLNGVHYGTIRTAIIDDDQTIVPWSDTYMLDVAIGDVLTSEVMRSAVGHDSGGLYATTSEWGTAPSTDIQISRVQ